MKRKDLYNYIKEEIIEALTEAGEKTAMVTTQSGKTSAVDYKTSDELNRIKDNTDIKSIETGTGQKIKEMANIVSMIKIQDPAKFALAKEVYTSGRTGALLDALSTAGEEGMTQKELGAALGLKNDSELNSIINNLRIAGVLSPKREKIVKPEKPTPEVEPELPTLTPDEEPEEEPVDTYYKDEEEETPEEEPTITTTKATDNLSKWIDALAKLNAKKDELVKKLKAKEITMDQYKEMIGNIPTQIKALQSKIDKFV
jgi:hypothetical protein